MDMNLDYGYAEEAPLWLQALDAVQEGFTISVVDAQGDHWFINRHEPEVFEIHQDIPEVASEYMPYEYIARLLQAAREISCE